MAPSSVSSPESGGGPATLSAAASPTAPPSRAKSDALGPQRRGRFLGRRAKKPKQLAVITDACTGCAGAPVCQICCPVEQCMLLVPATDALPFGRIWVDPLKCVGCRKCVSDGPQEIFLDGCPWDAIVMVTTDEWEKAHGELEY